MKRGSANGARFRYSNTSIYSIIFLITLIYSTLLSKFTLYYCSLFASVHCELSNDSHVFLAQQAESVGLDEDLPGEPSLEGPLQPEHTMEPPACEIRAPEPETGPVNYPWGFVSSQLLDSKGEEIFYRVKDDRDRKWAKRLEWVVKEHMDRAEDELDQLQGDFEDVLRQCKDARERKYDQQHIAALYKQLETAHRTIRDMRR